MSDIFTHVKNCLNCPALYQEQHVQGERIVHSCGRVKDISLGRILFKQNCDALTATCPEINSTIP